MLTEGPNIHLVGETPAQLATRRDTNAYQSVSLSEALVKAQDKGAIAAFSPSGLSLNEPAHLYHQALVRELFEGGHRRLGDAVLAAQSAYADTGAFPKLLSIYHLLGDPALNLR